MRHILTALILTLATSVAAQPFYVGTWKYDGGTCVFTEGEGTALRYTETEFWGTENRCQLTNPVQIRDLDGILFDLECWGEGTAYTERLLLLQEADGRLTTHNRGYTFTYERCE